MYLNLDNVLVERATKTVYKDGDKTIKLFVHDYSKADILNEALIQARVQEGTDLKIPQLIEINRIDDRWAIVSQHITGKSLEQLMNEQPEKMDDFLNIFVEIQLNILSKRVPLLNRIKDKYRRKLREATNIEEHIKYELLQRLEGMENHDKLCHGDFNPSNIVVTENNEYYIIDWAHATQGNASADAARTFLILSMQGKDELAEKYLNLFCERTNIQKSNVQRWIPIVAATQMTKNVSEEQEFLSKWVDVVDFQ